MFTLGCGDGTTIRDDLRRQGRALTTLTFTAMGNLNPPPPVNATVTDPAAIRALYDATLSLPDFPLSGPHTCPVDWYVRYRLDFAGDGVAAVATANPNGCQVVAFTSMSPPANLALWPSGSADDYWGLMAATIGVPEAAIIPYTPPAR